LSFLIRLPAIHLHKVKLKSMSSSNRGDCYWNYFRKALVKRHVRNRDEFGKLKGRNRKSFPGQKNET